MVAAVCLAAQLLIISVNVIMRDVFNSGISWVEEISKDVLMTAFTFLAWLDKGLRVLKHLVVGGWVSS